MKDKRVLFILVMGVFGLLVTETGLVGILPQVFKFYGIGIDQAGLMVSLFALAVALSGAILPLLMSGLNRRFVILLVLGIFTAGSGIAALTDNFYVALAARIIPAFFIQCFALLLLRLQQLLLLFQKMLQRLYLK